MSGKILGILGGLGPMASVYFYELVTAHTLVEKDQDHIDIVLSSKATTPDRTAFILGQSSEDPFAVMEDEARRLVDFGAEVLALPCNTAHFFFERLERAVPVPVLNMVADTVAAVQALGGTKAGILATDGTVQSGSYQKACEAAGLPCAVPGEKAQRDLMRLIYRDIKPGRPPDLTLFNAAAGELFAQGCSQLILGCTELSLIKRISKADRRCIDSMEVLAKSAITACGKTPTGFEF